MRHKKTFSIRDAAVFDLIILAFFILLAVKSLDYNPRARAIPLGVGIVGAVMMFLQFLADTMPAASSKLRFVRQQGLFGGAEERRRQPRPVSDPKTGEGIDETVSAEYKENTVAWPRVLRIVMWLAGFVILLKLVHYLVAVGLFLLFMTKVEAHEGWVWAMGVTVGTCILFFLLFGVILGAHL